MIKNKISSDVRIKSVNQSFLVKQTYLRKTFPFSDPCYYIKTTSGVQQKYHYLHVDSSCQLSSSGDQPILCAGHFKFTKNPDGSFAIYSMVKVIKMLNNEEKFKNKTFLACHRKNICARARILVHHHNQFFFAVIVMTISP
jgi:hypothetical protein